MAPTSFRKVEGLGNDFVLVDERSSGPEPRLPLPVRVTLCERHHGVGADGVLTVLPPRTSGAVATMHLTNADGTVAEMCGNGLRCVSLFLVESGAVGVGQPHVIDTGAGPRGCVVLEGGVVKVDMGHARFDVPAQFVKPMIREGAPPMTTVSMGNPHVVLEVAALPALDDATTVGRALEHDARFPQRTNVEWARANPDGSIDVVVWERGVGLTQACGTGACAVAVAFAKAGLVPYDVDVTVRLPGGPLVVRVPQNEAGPVWMTGPARTVFTGELSAT